MIAGVIMDIVIGILCIILGLVIWKKQKLKLLHEYQYRNVKAKDIPAYTRQVGIGLILIGAGITATGIWNLFDRTGISLIALAIGMISGTIVLFRAQKKYNGKYV